MAQMSINMDVVTTAANQISQLVTDLDTRTKKYKQQVEEAHNTTGGKWTLLGKLKQSLEAEVRCVSDINTALDSIKESLNRYADLMAEVDSADELRTVE